MSVVSNSPKKMKYGLEGVRVQGLEQMEMISWGEDGREVRC